MVQDMPVFFPAGGADDHPSECKMGRRFFSLMLFTDVFQYFLHLIECFLIDDGGVGTCSIITGDLTVINVFFFSR